MTSQIFGKKNYMDCRKSCLLRQKLVRLSQNYGKESTNFCLRQRHGEGIKKKALVRKLLIIKLDLYGAKKTSSPFIPLRRSLTDSRLRRINYFHSSVPLRSRPRCALLPSVVGEYNSVYAESPSARDISQIFHQIFIFPSVIKNLPNLHVTVGCLIHVATLGKLRVNAMLYPISNFPLWERQSNLNT